MVLPNTKVYPVKFISRDLYSQLERSLRELANRNKTQISFNFEDQYFDIEGRSQDACEDTESRIIQALLPELNRDIDDAKLKGTYKDNLNHVCQPVDYPSENNQPISRTPASPHAQLIEEGSPTSPGGRPFDAVIVPASSGRRNVAPYYKGDTDDSDDEYFNQKPEFTETFLIAKNVANPQDVLIGPPIGNLQPADYLKVVGQDTNTECCLVGREVRITGTDEDDVKDALERFKNLQTLYKRRRKGTTVVPCVHYPEESGFYELYFCLLEQYAHKSLVYLNEDMPRSLHVLLPVFKDPKTGDYKKPKDLITGPPAQTPVPASASAPPPQKEAISLSSSSSWNGQPNGNAYAQEQLNRTMQMVAQQQQQQQQFQKSRQPIQKRPTKPIVSSVTTPNPRGAMREDETPLWGENRAFVNNWSAASNNNAFSSGPSFISTSSPGQQKSTPQDEFPSLASTAPKPTVAPKNNTAPRRVIRITPQKSNRNTPAPETSLLEKVKEYNQNNMRNALAEGLRGVQGFKGEITLSAKLGKVLWGNLREDVYKNMWKFQDIKDIVMNEKGATPVFNNGTTKSEEIYKMILSLPPPSFERKSYFEIHADVRNQPMLPYKRVVMYMTQGVVQLDKVVTRNNPVTEINWISLDRIFDFQMSLKTQEVVRSDVKPYTTFIKRVAATLTSNTLTYEDVPDFLKVQDVLHKHTTRHRLHYPFIIEITRTQRLTRTPQPTMGITSQKIMCAYTGLDMWYDVEVFYSPHKAEFELNRKLAVGKLAPWTVETILGENDSQLIEYVRCLLLLTEKYQSVVS
ncbi:hypothetical protein F4703DRAFT_1823302 [Phycomyces blakesleeanus]